MKRRSYIYSVGAIYNRLISPRWLFIADGNDIYITSETINQDVKLSIHESGQCHIKIEYKSLLRFKDSPTNQDTYVEKWFLSNFKATLLQPVCRIIIPISSLSSNEFTKMSDHVIAFTDLGKTLNLHCYITSPRPVGEVIESSSIIIYQRQLPNLKCFVITCVESNSFIETELDMQEDIVANPKEKGIWDVLPNKLYGVATAYNLKDNLYSLIQFRINK